MSHTPPVSVPPWPQESSPPRLPISAPPTGLDECFFFIYLVSDFLAIRFSVSSGCARRCRVSTYAAILVPPEILSLWCALADPRSHLPGFIFRQKKDFLFQFFCIRLGLTLIGLCWANLLSSTQSLGLGGWVTLELSVKWALPQSTMT